MPSAPGGGGRGAGGLASDGCRPISPVHWRGGRRAQFAVLRSIPRHDGRLLRFETTAWPPASSPETLTAPERWLRHPRHRARGQHPRHGARCPVVVTGQPRSDSRPLAGFCRRGERRAPRRSANAIGRPKRTFDGATSSGPSGHGGHLPKGYSIDPFENGDSKGLRGSFRCLRKPSVFGRTAARGTVDLQDTIAPTPPPARARLARPGGEASHLWRDSLPPARAGVGAAEK